MRSGRLVLSVGYCSFRSFAVEFSDLLQFFGVVSSARIKLMCSLFDGKDMVI